MRAKCLVYWHSYSAEVRRSSKYRCSKYRCSSLSLTLKGDSSRYEIPDARVAMR